MKSKILSVLSPLACFLVVSCANNIVPEPEITPEMTVSETSFIFDGEGGDAEFTVKSNSSWKDSCDVSWITLSPSSGVAGTTNVKVSVNASDESEPRTGKITVTCDNIVKTIDVSQSEPETGNKLTFEFYGKLLISFPDIYGSKLLEAIIDWGDGSIEEHYYRGIEHIYDELGYYTITVKVANNTGLYFYNTNGFQSIDLSKF